MTGAAAGRRAVASYTGEPGQSTEGALTGLVQALASEVRFDGLRLREHPRAGRVTLWFRHGAKQLFHVSLVRRGGRYLVELHGGDPASALRLVSVCRDHFDRWFGVTPAQVRAFEAERAGGRE